MALARDVKVIHADHRATALRVDQDLIVINPAGTLMRAGTLETDFRFLVIKEIESSKPYIAGIQGRVVRWGSKYLYQGDSIADVER